MMKVLNGDITKDEDVYNYQTT